ncbi:heterokaryon incompatibility, partial [Lophiotrema nucula]
IPRTIRDAIKLVRSMGEKYLWVDCLCIEQDNTVQKHFQISRMDIVYSRALATIVALSSLDAAHPIPGVDPGTRLPFSSRWVREHCDDTAKSASGMYTVSFGSYPPLLESVFTDSVYERRGWTLQERLLP